MTTLECAECAAQIVVEREHYTISLRREPEETAPIDGAPETADELAKLQSETAMLMNVKRAAGVLGLACTAVFVYVGMSETSAHPTLFGTSVLACGTALLLMVIVITRHTTKVRAQFYGTHSRFNTRRLSKAGTRAVPQS
jgi:hypothetical protein